MSYVDEQIERSVREFGDLLFQIDVHGEGPDVAVHEIQVSLHETRIPIPIPILAGFYSSTLTLDVPVECRSGAVKIQFLLDIVVVVNADQEGTFIVTCCDRLAENEPDAA